MISILSVNFYADEFKKILLDSIERNKSDEVEILIHENTKEDNIGHGKALDKLVAEAKGDYILTIDIDAHILMKGFDMALVNYYENEKKAKLIAGAGGQIKPVRPCFMFFERKDFIENEMSFKPRTIDGASFDVGILFYFQMLTKFGDHCVFPLPSGKNQIYKDVMGNTYLFGNDPIVFHHWYGTRFNVDGFTHKKQVDSIKFEDFFNSRKNLIKHYQGKTQWATEE